MLKLYTCIRKTQLAPKKGESYVFSYTDIQSKHIL